MKSNTEFELISLNLIDIFQRFRQEYNNIQSLKESIVEAKGLINPVTLLRRKDGRFTLVAGGRRLMALKSLKTSGLNVEGKGIVYLKDIYPDEKIPATFLDSNVSSNDIRMVELMENVQREEFTPLEVAQLRAEIHKSFELKHISDTGIKSGPQAWSIRKTAEKIGLGHTQLSDDIRLASMAEKMPSLKNTTNRADALKSVDKIIKQAETFIKGNEIRKQNEEKPKSLIIKDLIDRYAIGNAFELGQRIDDNSLDLVESDSPFGIDLKNQSKGDRDDQSASGIYDNFEWSTADYLKNIQSICKLAYQKLKPSGFLILWFAPEPWFEITYQAMISAGFLGLRVPGLWIKPTGQCNNPHLYLANSAEYFFIGRKPEARMFKQGRTNIFQHTPVHNKDHRTEKPISLMSDIYQTFCAPGSRIWIPFLGSGNGIISAHMSNMSAFGSDMNDVYKNSYSIKVDQMFGTGRNIE